MWLQSPWGNAHKVLVPLLQKLKPYHPDFNTGKLTKEKLLQRVQPEGSYSLSRINNLLSKGFIAAEEFMVFQYLKKDENLRNDILTREQQSRHLEDWFFKNIDSEIERIENKEVKEWEDHLALLHLHRRFYHHPNSGPRMQPGGKTIVEMGNQLDLVYLLEKAAIINEKIFRNRILKNENHPIKKELNAWRVIAEASNHPVVELYKMRFEYSEENMVEQFFKVRDYFFKNHTQMNSFQCQIHLLSLTNDANFLKRKKIVSIKDTLSIYKFGFESKILPAENRISENTYTTVVSFSNAIGDFAYTRKFIDSYTKHLEDELQSEAEKWALAHLNYREGNLEKSLDFLIQNPFYSVYFKRATKVLNLQVYFDLSIENPSYLEYFFDYSLAFEKWIQREKNYSKSKKNTFLRFIQKSKELVKWHYEKEAKKDSLPDFLAKETNIIAGNWLQTKYGKIRSTKS